MYIMYTTDRSGAMDIDLKWQLPDPQFETIKRQALRMMKYRNSSPHCIKHLEETPYSLCTADNGYGDKFEVLRWIASPKEYTDMERFLDQGNYLEQDCFPDICEAFKTVGHPLRFIIMDIDLMADDGVATVAPPVLRTTSDTVEVALKDAETLINTTGAPNAFDRVHTAFHGYLKEICEEDPFTYNVAADADITTLFNELRRHHPKLQITDPQADKMMIDIMRGFSRAIDALNPARNSKSMAHPNTLLEPPEAMLAINAIRTMLHYLDNKLK